MLVGFTGTQKGMTTFQKIELRKLLERWECKEFIFGDCIGADREACDIALECGVRAFTIHPPNNSTKRAWCFDTTRLSVSDYGARTWQCITFGPHGIVRVRWMPREEYLARNRNIVVQAERMIATPKEYHHTLRSGTWATIRYAWKIKKDKLTIIPPVEREE